MEQHLKEMEGPRGALLFSKAKHFEEWGIQ